MMPVTYQFAKEQFDSIRKPPRSKKYAENQRPLRRVPESWLMLQKDPHSYVYRINNEEVVRVFEPNENGDYEVAVRGLYNTYDINLMWKFTRYWNGMTLVTDKGDEVKVPLNAFFYAQDKEFSAFLTFNRAHQLVVERSWHADVYKRASTSTDKAKRKSIKQQLDAYVTLQMFKLPTIRANAKPDNRQGEPFGQLDCPYKIEDEMRAFLKADEIDVTNSRFAEVFDVIAQSAFNMLASKRIYNAEVSELGSGIRHGSGLFYAADGNSWYTRNEPDAQAKAQAKIDEMIESITPEDYKTSLVQTLMKYANLQKGSEYIPLPQFATALPRTYYTKKG